MKIFKWILRGFLVLLAFIFIVGGIHNPGILVAFGAGFALLFIGWSKLDMTMPKTRKKIDKKAKKTSGKAAKSLWDFLIH